jgi:hypothetical protein
MKTVIFILLLQFFGLLEAKDIDLREQVLDFKFNIETTQLEMRVSKLISINTQTYEKMSAQAEIAKKRFKGANYEK